ncbi:MAG: RNA polymerase sigma factor [Chthoniobacterales bacterium]
MADADLALVQALQAGDDTALDELMERHQGPLFRFIRGYVGNEADAMELAQETFVRAYFKIGQFKPTAKFATWLYRIALNLCRDHAKSRRARQAAATDSLSNEQDASTAEGDLPAASKTPAEEALASEKMAALDRAIAQLPHDLRTALILAVFEQRTHQESAELLGTTPKTIETRVYRARKLLLDWMTRAGF